MKILAAVMTSVCVIGYAVNASADVYVDMVKMVDNKGNSINIPSIDVSNKVWVKCRGCGRYEPVIKEMLRVSGVTVVETTGEADTRLVFLSTVNVPKDGRVSEMAAEEISDAYAATIPAALSKGAGSKSHGGSTPGARGILDTDAGAISQGASLTGGSVGGFLIGMLGAFGGRLLDQHAADAKRVPGMADTSVRVVSSGANYFFALKAAADSPETPDSIVRASFARAVEILMSGLAIQPKSSTNGVKP